MYINYYFIPGCTYSPYQGKNVIFAPDGTDEDLLQQYDFQKAEDGRYFRILTEQEYQAVKRGYPNNNVIFSYENSQPMYHNPNRKTSKKLPDFIPSPSDSETENQKDEKGILISNILCIFSFLFAAIGTILWTYHDTNIDFLVSVGMFIIGGILALIVKIRYPENILGTILFGVYTVLFLIAMFVIVKLVAFMVSCCMACL